MKVVRIYTPKADQFLELIGRRDFESAQSGDDYSASWFDEILLVHGATRLHWRFDERTPEHAGSASTFHDVATATGIFRDQPMTLTKHGWLELEFHVSTPLSPHEKGIWVRLLFQIVDGNLAFSDSGLRRCATHVADGDEADSGAPKWLTQFDDRWVLDQKKRPPSRGNPLLCAALVRALGRSNLIDIDETLRPKKSSDASLAFVLEQREDGYEVCTELVLSASFVPAAAVSGYALLLDDARRVRTPLDAQGMRLRTWHNDSRDGWHLRWLDVAGAQGARDPGVLTLESLSQALFESHALGLATTRSRNRLSMLPTWIATADAAQTLILRFDLAGDAQRVVDVRLAAVELGPLPREVVLHCGGALDRDAHSVELRATARDAQSEIGKFLCWTLGAPAIADQARQLGIGSVLLSVEGLKGGELRIGVANKGGNSYRRAPLESRLELRFDSATYAALSTDPELGFETLTAIVARDRPWTVDLQEPQACLLSVQEEANQRQSRRLRLELKLSDQGVRKTDVVLVDPCPLTLVRVETVERQEGGGILAEYLDDADQAPEWRFHSNKGHMTATLPPQGIGEEMVKGYLHLDRAGQKPDERIRTRVPVDGELFDFRLTPVARLVLDRTDIDMARSEAPWSVRRLLGRRLGAIGVKLEQADFELLYGLAVHLEAPGLRVAELDGFVGRVPYSDDLLQEFAQPEVGTPRQRYALQAAQWLSCLWNRPSWWRVYRDIAQRDRLTIDQAVQYRLRAARQTAHPFNIGQFANGGTRQPGDPEPLRGGVDWAFQSRNVYTELVDAPVSSGGSIEGLAFGSLGGEGAQTAAFNNGKTLIITSSRQGRIDSLTLIRIGRIAMLWNKARHVIVYERTTRRSPRYDDDEPADQKDTLEAQPPFVGIAALRKVREYVEITEPRRRYPDNKPTLPISGPLVQSVFATTTIPVRSDWGRDVRDGFVMALRGPVPDKHELEFPDPKVFLDLARAPDKGEGAIAQRIRSTERLVFFSSTRKQDGGDSDAWPAWPDVDFPLLAPPAPPELPFNTSFQGRRRQPDAAAVELGMAPFTFALDSAEEAANLMHERDVPGMEAKVANINVARGLPTEVRAQELPVERISRAFAGAQAQLVDGLAELRAELRERVAAGDGSALSAQPQLLHDVRKLLDRLTKAVAIGEVPTDAPKREWLAQQQERGDRYKEAVARDGEGLRQQLVGLAQALSADPEVARGQASALLDVVKHQALQRIEEVGFVPREALAAVRRLLDALRGRFEVKLVGMAGELVSVISRLEQAYRFDPDQAVDLEEQWQEMFATLPAQLRQLPDALDQMMDGALGDWFSRLKKDADATIHQVLRDSVETQLPNVVDWLVRWNESLPPFDIEPPDFGAMRQTVSDLVGKPLAEAMLESAVRRVAELWNELIEYDDLLGAGRKLLEDWAEQLSSELRDAVSPDEIERALRDAAEQFSGTLKAAADGIAESLRQQVESLSFGGLQGSLDALGQFKDETEKALTAIGNSLQGTVGDLERAVREQAAIAENFAQAGARQLEDWARSSLGPTIDIAKSNVNAGLETLRVLAEGPVTEAMDVSRELLGYYYHQAEQTLGLTRASAYFNELGQGVLNSLSTAMPFDRLRERLLPQLDGMAIRDLFPDFCGIKLTHFLPDLDVPLDGSHEYEWIRLQHGFERDRLRAWAKVNINKQFEEDATLFDLGPVKLRLLTPHFVADSDISAAQDGTRWQRTSAALNADFELSLNNKPMVTLREGSLNFDEQGELRFNFESEKLELAPELQFVTDALKAMMPQVEGATITPLLPSGVSAAMSLPLPDIGTGAFTLTGVTLNTHLDLLIADGFEIRTGLWLSKPDRPFGLAVLFLGGGGWFGIDASYKPPTKFATRVSIGVSAGAFLAVNFGFAQGSAGILFTAGVDFYRDWESGKGSTAVSLGLLIWGEFSVMGIASASIRLHLQITYTDAGGLNGRGTFSVRIRICWCFTLRVSRSVEKNFAGAKKGDGGGQRSRVSATSASAARTALKRLASADDYGQLPVIDVRSAVTRFYDTLAI